MARVEGEIPRHGFVEFACFRRIGRRQDHGERQDQIAGRATGNTLSANAQRTTALRSGRHPHLESTTRQIDADDGAERGLPRGNRQIEVQIAPFSAQAVMLTKMYFKKSIPRRGPIESRRPLTGQADDLPCAYADRNPYVQRATFQRHMALSVKLRNAQ